MMNMGYMPTPNSSIAPKYFRSIVDALRTVLGTTLGKAGELRYSIKPTDYGLIGKIAMGNNNIGVGVQRGKLELRVSLSEDYINELARKTADEVIERAWKDGYLVPRSYREEIEGQVKDELSKISSKYTIGLSVLDRFLLGFPVGKVREWWAKRMVSKYAPNIVETAKNQNKQAVNIVKRIKELSEEELIKASQDVVRLIFGE